VTACEVLLEICLLCLFTSWKLSSWAIDQFVILYLMYILVPNFWRCCLDL
jgi:hypothetical protein